MAHFIMTQEDIDKAKAMRDDPDQLFLSMFCPISQCISRTLPDGYEVNTQTEYVAYWNDKEVKDDDWRYPIMRAMLTPDAVDFIMRFDGGENVSPIEFDLEFKEMP